MSNKRNDRLRRIPTAKQEVFQQPQPQPQLPAWKPVEGRQARAVLLSKESDGTDITVARILMEAEDRYFYIEMQEFYRKPTASRLYDSSEARRAYMERYMGPFSGFFGPASRDHTLRMPEPRYLMVEVSKEQAAAMLDNRPKKKPASVRPATMVHVNEVLRQVFGEDLDG